MRSLVLRSLFAMLVAAGAPCASAAISCNVTSPGVSGDYDPAAGQTDVTQSYFTVTCTRGSNADPATVNWSVSANNGLNPGGGGNNRAQRGGFGGGGGNRISYDIYRDAGCTSRFQGGGTITGSMTFSATGTQSQQGNFWMCIAAGQAVAAGTFTDTVTLTLTYNSFFTDTGALAVSIVSPPACTVPAAPGSVVLNYTAFGPLVNGSTTFQVRCSAGQPYTMALDATSGSLLGLTYTLALSSASSSGTGANQTHTITGSIAAGQAGTCASGTCTATAVRTLTVTY